MLLSLVVKPDGDELSQGRAVLTEDPECPIAGAGHGAGFLDDVAQEGGEIEVRHRVCDGAWWRPQWSDAASAGALATEALKLKLGWKGRHNGIALDTQLRMLSRGHDRNPRYLW